ncbi:DUF3318 domain-containing protein [Candidatus Vallotia tarda]|uniref:Uncharacterized protein n=1 Tax=Candidatus Vallotiella hemipterorum TaxID=1177213 RepID=A0A916JUE0_9BURK|nr:DUF3318 domain-containing protein [Candidatus Vallotia tarda]CAG7601449.1 Putative uncharacterized protein [Candidatus Vallotia tarda]
MNNTHSSSHLAYLTSMRGLNYPKGKVRGLRKEVLRARADRNRLDIVSAGQEMFYDISRFNWMRWLIPGINRYRLLCKFPLAVRKFLDQHPVLSSIASAILAGPIRRVIIHNAKPLLKWSVIGIAAWKCYFLWKAVRPKHRTTTTHEY